MKNELNAMPVMIPGSASGSTKQERDRLPAEEAVARHGGRGHRPEHERDHSGDGADLQRELERAAGVGCATQR